jgi:general secretion pathway protein G
MRGNRFACADALLQVRPPERSRRGEHGYTLFELLVVLAIISLIVGLVGPRVLGHLSDSKAKAARIQIEGFAAALDIYFLDNGRCWPNGKVDGGKG